MDGDEEPVPEGLRQEFPELAFWRGTSGRYYSGRDGTTGPVLAEGEDWADLRDMTRKAIAEQAAAAIWRERNEALREGRPVP